MSPNIDIDIDVLDLLKREAEPFVDTPNTVLRRLLGMNGQPQPEADEERQGSSVSPQERSIKIVSKGRRRRRKGSRAPAGSLLPESEYEQPILRVLGERGGSAPARDAIELVGQLVDDQLKPLDREDLPSGLKRWESRVQFTRLRMRKAGLIQDNSPRGIWELSDKGLTAYRRLRAAA